MATNVVPLKIGNVEFQCVHLDSVEYKDIAAVYVILCVEKGGSWTVLDVGQSGGLGERIDNHDRRECWKRNCPSGNIWVCVYPMPTATYTKQQRLDFEKKLRDQYNPPCGKR